MDLECTKLLSSEEEEKKLGKVLCLRAHDRLLSIDLDKLPENFISQTSSSTKQEKDLLSCIESYQPSVTTFPVEGLFAAGTFFFKNRVLFVSIDRDCYDGGCGEQYAKELYEINFESSIPDPNSGNFLAPTSIIPPLTHPKPYPIIEIIGRKVYVLSKLCVDPELRNETHFEVLDLAASSLRWIPLPNPGWYVTDTPHVATRVHHYVSGSRICLVVHRAGLSFYDFDTETKSWDKSRHYVHFSLPKFPRFLPCLGAKFVSLPPLDGFVMLSFYRPVRGIDPGCHTLFAIHVDSSDKPLRYQDITHCVFSDHNLPPTFVTIFVNVFVFEEGLNCAIRTGYIDIARAHGFAAMSFFKLVPKAGETDEGDMHAETQFLDVVVKKQCFTWLAPRHLYLRSAYLL